MKVTMKNGQKVDHRFVRKIARQTIDTMRSNTKQFPDIGDNQSMYQAVTRDFRRLGIAGCCLF